MKAVRGARPVPLGNLHVTLAFLGGVARERVRELSYLARRVACALPARSLPLVLNFDRLEHWVRPQLLCALASEERAALAAPGAQLPGDSGGAARADRAGVQRVCHPAAEVGAPGER